MRRYFPSIRYYSWILLVCVVLALAVGGFLAKAQPTTYYANAIITVDAGAPGTTLPGGAGINTDSIGQAAAYAAEIPTRSVLAFVYQSDPKIKERHYSVNDLLLNVTVAAPSTTTPNLTITAIGTKPDDAVLLVNDVAKGFQAYKTQQLQQQLDAQRQYLQEQYNQYKAQSSQLYNQILRYNNSSDPHIALLTADRSSAIQTMNAIQSQLLQLPNSVHSDVFLLQLAELRDVTTSSKGILIFAACGGVGLLLGLVLMALMIFLDNRLRGDDLVKEKLGFAYLGGLSKSNEIKDTPTALAGLAMQQMADICTNLKLTHVLPEQWHAPQGAVLLVTSSQTAEGKSSIVAGLASVVARAGGSVAVVDGNLRAPSTHLTFGVSPTGFGLSGLLKATGPENIDGAVQRSNVPGIWILPGGAPMEDPTFLLGQKLPGILAQLRKKTDLVIIDGPALLSSSDALLLATMVDGVALVLDARHDKMSILQRAKELLTSLTHTPAGVILNRIPRRKKNGYYASASSEDALEKDAAVQKSTGNGHNVGSGQSTGINPTGNLMPAGLMNAPVSPRPAAPMELPIMQPNPPSPFPPAPRRMDMTPPQQ